MTSPITPERRARLREQVAVNAETAEGVGTGAGEDATGQDTGTAWVTRSEDCPEAPAQAHPLGPSGWTDKERAAALDDGVIA